MSHPPGHTQCDFGEALVVIGGMEQKAYCFVLDLPHGDGCYVKGLPCGDHRGLPGRPCVSLCIPGRGAPEHPLRQYQAAVARILGDGRRQRTRAFTELQSHYLFEDRFGRPGKGNGKGKVESLVGYARRNFLVPIPSFESFEVLNASPGALLPGTDGREAPGP